MASAFESAATAIIAIFQAEFSAEGFTMIPDRLHESLGRYRVDVGISPDEERPMLRDRNTLEHYFTVQFYDLWTDEISPDTQVNPFRIAGFAERFKTALRDGNPGSDGRMWYFDIDRLQYPNDPTGNKTRFVASIRAYGANSGLIETTG